MHQLFKYRKTALATATAALMAVSFMGGPASAQVAEAPSTPVPISTPDGVLMSYVINVKNANPGQTRLAEQAVRDAGGVVVQSWPQIGVVVAHSTKSTFRTDVARLAKGNAVQSVGATRTVGVTEGTPEIGDTPRTPGSRGASHYKKANGQPKLGGFVAGEVYDVAPMTDPNEGRQWDMVQIKADQAHQITDGARSVLVGVLDSGIESSHPDLAPNMDLAASVNCSNAGRPDTSEGASEPTTSAHGTHVAGTIAAARNGEGIVGVAPNVRLASVKVVNDDGYIYPEYAVCGFVWAAEHGVDVTNNSYYVDPFEFWCDDQSDQAASKEAVRRAVAYSEKLGVVSVAAAGNSSYDLANKTVDNGSPNDAAAPTKRTINSGCHDIPTELPGVVTVSSTTSTQALSSFSNRGLGVIDVAAPGSSILSTYPGGRYATMSGTSMASPHVAGVMALLKSVYPKSSPAQLVSMLRAQADDHACTTTTVGAACVGTPLDNSFYGEGIADALKAVR